MSARRPWAWPLVPVYSAVLRVKEALRGEAKKLAWPVVSVGSISAGGAGKTPVVIALAIMLREHGWGVDVLSRGYGRMAHGTELVDVAAADAAKRFGDEPVLIAERAAVPVWVGAKRFEAGLRAEEDNVGRGVHLLDDGFQHRQLARTFDLVLVTADDLHDALLPAGNLREGFAALGRADAVLIREEEREAVEPALRKLLQKPTLVWSVHRRLRFPSPLGVLSAGLRPVAFCAIARPEGFAAMLIEAGCGIADTIAFDDHARYGPGEIEQIVELATQLKATGLVTTEKDAVKLSAAQRARLETVGPMVVVVLDAVFLYPERVMRELEGRLG